jgi:hypothetical protein
MKNQTVKAALREKRRERKGNLESLVLCKRELFYMPEIDKSAEGSVYPVDLELAQKEAEWFGVSLYES